MELAKTYLHYLSFEIFSPHLFKDELESNLLSGSYRLHRLAYFSWARATAECLRTDWLPSDFLDLLEKLYKQRENDEHAVDNKGNHEVLTCLSARPDLQNFIHRTLEFSEFQAQDDNWRLDDGMYPSSP